MRKLLTLAAGAMLALLIPTAGAMAADVTANIAKGRVIEFMNRVDNNDPTNSAIVVGLLKLSQADSALIDFDDLDALLANAGNTEADFTNYTRKVQSDTEITFGAPDDTNDRYDADLPDITWTSAGGASNNSIVKLFIGYDPDTTSGDDTEIIPLTLQDFSATTDGNDLTATINVFFRAN